MNARIDYRRLDPKVTQTLLSLNGLVERSGLDAKLLHLVQMRASQMNGCAYCLDMHSKDARAAGETEQRLYGLSAWRDTPYYSERERAALEWVEAITLVSETYVPDTAYEAVRAQFSEDEIANLTLAAVLINAWNRLNVALRTVPGAYKPGMFRPQAQATG
jgi:AhpD family alkylhydroperoxidase